MEALARRAAAPVFALALFSSAALIFILQPLFARMVTPLLGGSPQVWNTSMAFFQGALLVGYLYAHLLARVKDLRIQAAVHGLVLLAAWFVLPVHVAGALGQPSSEHPALWLLGTLTLSVGAPFAAASATAPLLQSWYARTGRADAHDPYYLYAASNLGSFIGLLGYPILVEPLLGAHAQSLAWTGGYVVVGALIVLAAAMAIAAHGPGPAKEIHTSAAPTWRDRAYWVGAAAVPSAMSLGVTLHISTDVASAPMLWVLPLALYLATFVLAFMKGNERLDAATLLIQPFALAAMVMSYFSGGNWMMSITLILTGFFFCALICHLALSRTRPSADRLTEFYFFVSLGGVLGGSFAALLAPLIFNNVYEFPLAIAAACLFRPRTPTDMPRFADASLASAIGGTFIALLLLRIESLDACVAFAAIGAAAAMIAAGWGSEGRPQAYRYSFLAAAAVHACLVIWAGFHISDVFARSVVEGHPQIDTRAPWSWLLLASSFLVLTFAVHGTVQRRKEGESAIGDFALGVVIPSAVVMIMIVLAGARVNNEFITILSLLFCGIAIFFNRGRPIVMAGVVLLAFVMIFLDDARGGRVVDQERTFFGVLRTRVFELTDTSVPPLRVLMHGTTLHGAQIDAPQLSRLPLTYYNPRTALGESILAGLTTHPQANLALIGLGTGSTACLMRPDDHLTIFEIDPAVVRLSAHPGTNFTFVPQCQPNAEVVVGDARLQIAHQPDHKFNVIVVDAFSSDAIPAHLLTREALNLYLDKATDDGIVILHLSNRHLALVSEAARVARDLHAPTLYRVSNAFSVPGAVMYGASAASVMIVARNPATLARLPVNMADWSVVPAPDGRAWSDDYINLPRALWEGLPLVGGRSSIEQCRLYPDLQECRANNGGQTATPPAPPPITPPARQPASPDN